MQSDTFLPDTDSDDEDNSSDSSEDLPKNNNIGVKYDPKMNEGRFLDQSSHEHYEKINRDIFNPQLRRDRIFFDTFASGAYLNIIDLVDTYKLNGLNNVIGIELISASVLSKDITHRYIDIVIPEIPSIACKLNDNGISVIDRIPLDLSTSTTYKHSQSLSYQNYFTPIKLSTLTVKQILPDKDIGDYKAIYEFEITIFNDTLSKR